jgi:hypothetical protein
LCETEDLDLVINAVRPWKWHAPICVAAMTAGRENSAIIWAAIAVIFVRSAVAASYWMVVVPVLSVAEVKLP